MTMPNHHARVLIVYRSPLDEDFCNVLWYQLSDAPSPPETFPTALADVLWPDIDDCYGDVLPASWHIQTIYVQLSTSGLAFDGVSSASPTTGSVTDSDYLPCHNAVIIQKRTAHPGKSGRGRWYITGIPEAFATGDVVSNSAVNEYDAVREELTATRVAAGVTCTPCHHSAKENALYPITLTRLMMTLGTQRGRLPRRLIPT